VIERGEVARTSTPHFQRRCSRLLAKSKLHHVSGGTTTLGFSDGHGDSQTDPRAKPGLFGDHRTLCAKAPTVSGLPLPAGISELESPIAPEFGRRLSRIITYYHARRDGEVAKSRTGRWTCARRFPCVSRAGALKKKILCLGLRTASEAKGGPNAGLVSASYHFAPCKMNLGKAGKCDSLLNLRRAHSFARGRGRMTGGG
jgi:hypothetical protein